MLTFVICLVYHSEKKNCVGACTVDNVSGHASLNQGRNEVYFFIADPVILPKFLIPGSKRDENFDPLSCKILLIENA